MGLVTPFGSIEICLFDPTEPVLPGNISPMNQDGLVVSVVSNVFEEDSPSKQRDLKSLDVEIDTEVMPGICSDGIRHEGSEKPIEVEEEEHGPRRG